MYFIQSRSIEGPKTKVPFYFDHLKMKAINPITLQGVPRRFRCLVREMFTMLPVLPDLAYLTIDGRLLKPNETHRRPGPHIDGNYLPEICGWGSGGGNGWKVSEPGTLNDVEYERSYHNVNGGLLMISSKEGCRGWNGLFAGKPGVGGDCSHIDFTDPMNNLENTFILEPNRVYYGNSRFIHESIPSKKLQYRTLVRITLPEDYPFIS